jgi:hypothetical protein
MSKRTGVFIGLLCFLLSVLASCNLTPQDNTSLPTFTVEPITSEDEFEEGLANTETWVRIDLVSRLTQTLAAGKTLAVESITLCQVESCYSINHNKNINLSDLDDSMGTPLTGALVPSGHYTQISVKLSAQQSEGAVGLVAETVKFRKPIILENQLRTDIFLAVESATPEKANLRFLTSGLVAPDVVEPFIFEPGHTALLSLPSGFRLELSPDSLDKATIFSWNEHDVLDISSFYSFYPEVNLKKPAKVTLPVDMNRMPERLSLSDFQLQLNGDMVNLAPLKTSSMASVPSALLYELPVLNTFKLTSTQPSVQTSDGKSYGYPRPDSLLMPADADVSVCARTLATNLTTYIGQLSATPPTLRIMDCEGIAPFVHIIMVDLNSNFLAPLGNKDRWGKIALPTTKNAQGEYLLKTISQHASSVNAIAAINGFTWAGDRGTGPNQTGTFQSTTYIKGVKVGSRSGAEAIIAFSEPRVRADDSAYTLSKLFDKAANTTPDLSFYNYNALGSSTSIIKNGSCSRVANEGEVERWSAIGIGNGRLVMVSSLTGKRTTAFELCSVFRALNATGGTIRLDGGPSTAIYYKGSVLNPLAFPTSTIYGSQRRILNAIAITK